MAETSQTTDIGLRDPVNDAQITDFLDRVENGARVVDAAAAAGIHTRTGYRLLSRYQTNVEAVQNLLKLKAVEAAEHWIEASTVAASKGDHRPAKEWLQTIKAVDPIDAGAHAGANVTIIIGTPDAPIRVFPQEKAIPSTTSSGSDQDT
jgi:hypothetical protein